MTSLLPLLLAFSFQQNPDSVVARAARVIKPLTDSVSLHNAGFTPLAAEKGGDKAKFDALRKKTISTYNTLLAAYRALATSPQIESRLDVELAEILGDEHMKMP